MLTIKLIDVRMMVLRAAMKKEEQRLQNVADQVARIAAGLDMDLKSSAGIAEILAKLRKNLKKQSGHWGVMQQLAEQASAELHQKDADVAKKANGLDYSARQFAQSVQTNAFFSAAGGKLVQNVASPGLGLSALNKLDLTKELGQLFDGIGGGFGDALQGVSLGELSENSLTSSLKGVLDRIEVEDVLTAAGTGVAGMAGIMGLTALLDKNLGSSEIIPGANAKVLNVDPTYARVEAFQAKAEKRMDQMRDIYNSAAAKSPQTQKKGVLDYLEDGAEWVAGKAEDAGEAVWDGLTWIGEKAVDTGEAVWDGMKWLDEKTLDFANYVANSKPMEYVWDMGGSVIGGVADVGSFCWNVLSGDFVGAGADGYSFINNFFDFAQDGSALFIYGMGAGADALGVDQSKVDFLYAEAEDYHNREGLAGELRDAGWDSAADVVQTTDAVVDTYKLFTGIKEFADGSLKPGENPMYRYRKNLYELTGWKLVDDYGDYATYTQKIKYFADVSSNADLAYKYADGGLNGEGLKTILENTQIGKIVTAPGKIMEKSSDSVS